MTILGTLDIRDWDTGAILTLGGELSQYVVDGETRQVYTVAVPGVDSGLTHLNNRVPLMYKSPEDPYQDFILPSFMFKRNDMAPAFERQPWYQWVARAPSKGAKKIILPDGREGYDRYDNQFRATPFDISYDVTLMARRQQDSVHMIKYALRHFIPPWFAFKVVDSLGDVRHYDAGEVTFSDNSELIDIEDRMVGWNISFTVRGEIDIHDDREYPAVLAPTATYSQYRPQ